MPQKTEHLSSRVASEPREAKQKQDMMTVAGDQPSMLMPIPPIRDVVLSLSLFVSNYFVSSRTKNSKVQKKVSAAYVSMA